jgi:predicted transcriptional regulator
MGEHEPAFDRDGDIDVNALRMWADAQSVDVEHVLQSPDLLARFLAWDEAFVAAVREGLADIAAGRTVSHEEMLEHCAERRRRYLERRA